jgi:hypothetical protein
MAAGQQGAPSVERACPLNCNDPVFERTELVEAGISCPGSASANLRSFDQWYLRLEQEAWRLFQQSSEDVSMAERREFLNRYVESATPILTYDVVRFALVDNLVLAALRWTYEKGADSAFAYNRWTQRASMPGQRSEPLQRCHRAIQSYLDEVQSAEGQSEERSGQRDDRTLR